MDWRVTIELSGADGTTETREVARGGGTDPYRLLEPLGLTLGDGKSLLASVQWHLVQARVAKYSALRRRCSDCRCLRPLKDTCTRRLNSLFGTVEVPAPRFKPCRCATARPTLAPASELMPDRSAPEHERTLAKMVAWVPYRCPTSSLSRTAAGPRGLGRTSNVNPVLSENAARGAAFGDDDGVDRRRARPGCARSSRQDVRGDGGPGQQ